MFLQLVQITVHSQITYKENDIFEVYFNSSHFYRKNIQACDHFLKMSPPEPVISSKVEIQMMLTKDQEITTVLITTLTVSS